MYVVIVFSRDGSAQARLIRRESGRLRKMTWTSCKAFAQVFRVRVEQSLMQRAQCSCFFLQGVRLRCMKVSCCPRHLTCLRVDKSAKYFKFKLDRVKRVSDFASCCKLHRTCFESFSNQLSREACHSKFQSQRSNSQDFRPSASINLPQMARGIMFAPVSQPPFSAN